MLVARPPLSEMQQGVVGSNLAYAKPNFLAAPNINFAQPAACLQIGVKPFLKSYLQTLIGLYICKEFALR